MSIAAFPLQWPVGWKRAPERKSGRFSKKVPGSYGRGISVMDGIERVLSELHALGIEREDVVISTNLKTRLDGLPRSDSPKPSDPGVCVYWQAGKDTRCMPIDMYDDVAQNLGAVAATLEAMRAIERHGGSAVLDRAFTGFLALPERTDTPWREVLELTKGNVDIATVKFRYRELSKKYHPDFGGTTELFSTLTKAYEQALSELGAS